jgi:hypothetical protein
MKKEPFHISGKLHLTGSSRFIGDEAPLAGMLYASFLYSPVATPASFPSIVPLPCKSLA